MGIYSSAPEATITTETARSNVVLQSINAYKCGIQMAKKEKNSEGIIELINRNIVPTNATKEEYDQVIELLNELMLTLAENDDNNSNEVLSLDRIIKSVIYDRDHDAEDEAQTSGDDE
jgi:hypothetical protein